MRLSVISRSLSEIGYRGIKFVDCYPCVLTSGYTVVFETQGGKRVAVPVDYSECVGSSTLWIAEILSDRIEEALKQMQPPTSNPGTRAGLRQIEV